MQVLPFCQSPSRGVLLCVVALGLTACNEAPMASPDAPGMAGAKPSGSSGAPTVTATDPPYGHQGDQGLSVRITGTGFAPGASASWERNGSADPKITILSTTYVSSTALDARITIAPDATVSLYDVAVYSGGKKGIGTERFEVSTAIAITGAGLARGVNNTGEMTGRAPAWFWSPFTGLDTLDITAGGGWDVSDDGLTVAGGFNGPAIWTRSGTVWTALSLPRSAGSNADGNAQTIASDPGTGAATAIGGVEVFPLKGNKVRREPRVWLWTGSGWQMKALPGIGSSTEGQVHDLNASLMVAGNTPSGATIWTPNGSGGWTATVIGPAGSDASAINSTGDFAVGTSGGLATYWRKSGSVWGAPVTIPGGCTNASDVADNGRIVAQVCPVSNQRVTSAVIEPPYGAADVTFLSGFGNSADGAQVEAISRSGNWLVGRALYGASGTVVAAYWNMP